MASSITALWLVKRWPHWTALATSTARHAGSPRRARRVLPGAGIDVGYLEVLQSRSRAAHPRLARHSLLVDVGCKRLGRPGRLVADVAPLPLHQLAQRLTPCLLVRRV